MIRGIREHLFAVLRDLLYAHEDLVDSDRFDLSSSRGITDAVFHILRNARVLSPQADPRLVVCWGGHAISRAEYDYTKTVGYQLGLRGLDVCTGCGAGAMKGPMKGATLGHAKQRLHERALSGSDRADDHRGRVAEPDRQRARDPARHGKAARGLRAPRARDRRLSGRRRHGRGDPVSARHPARFRQSPDRSAARVHGAAAAAQRTSSDCTPSSAGPLVRPRSRATGSCSAIPPASPGRSRTASRSCAEPGPRPTTRTSSIGSSRSGSSSRSPSRRLTNRWRRLQLDRNQDLAQPGHQPAPSVLRDRGG